MRRITESNNVSEGLVTALSASNPAQYKQLYFVQFRGDLTKQRSRSWIICFCSRKDVELEEMSNVEEGFRFSKKDNVVKRKYMSFSRKTDGEKGERRSEKTPRLSDACYRDKQTSI